MHLAHARAFHADPAAEWQTAVPLQLVREPVAPRYGERRPNFVALLAILALHAAAIVALVALDVIPVARPHYSELKVVDIADAPPPPLAAAPPPPDHAAPPRPAPSPIVAPPPIVAVPVSAAALVVTAPAPAPAIEPAAAPAAAPGPVIVAPITAPNGLARSLDNPSPRYPTESRRKREEGVVRLRVVITAEGRVKEIAVARTSGHDRLDEAALDAVRRWHFLPGLQGGNPVEAVGFLNIPFQIKA